MKLSKIFVSSAAAASVVGVIGFAYAQTYNPTPPTSNPQTQPEVQSPVQTLPADTNMQNQRRNSSTGTTGSMNDNTRMSGDNSTSSMGNNGNASMDNNRSTERMARADRN